MKRPRRSALSRLALSLPLAPGTRVNGQFWSRDPAQPDGTGMGLTDAIELETCP